MSDDSDEVEALETDRLQDKWGENEEDLQLLMGRAWTD